MIFQNIEHKVSEFYGILPHVFSCLPPRQLVMQYTHSFVSKFCFQKKKEN